MTDYAFLVRTANSLAFTEHITGNPLRLTLAGHSDQHFSILGKCAYLDRVPLSKSHTTLLALVRAGKDRLWLAGSTEAIATGTVLVNLDRGSVITNILAAQCAVENPTVTHLSIDTTTSVLSAFLKRYE